METEGKEENEKGERGEKRKCQEKERSKRTRGKKIFHSEKEQQGDGDTKTLPSSHYLAEEHLCRQHRYSPHHYHHHHNRYLRRRRRHHHHRDDYYHLSSCRVLLQSRSVAMEIWDIDVASHRLGFAGNVTLMPQNCPHYDGPPTFGATRRARS